MDTSLYTSPDRTPAQGVSLAAVAYASVKRDLLGGVFPLSRRLVEERLATDLEMSRTPIREALSRLHTEGLVDRHPDGGYTPAIPDLDEIVELYEVRAVLEQAALAKADHDRAALLALQDDWQAMGQGTETLSADPEFALLDEDFHLRLAASAGNRSLVSTLSGVNERIRIVRMHDFLQLSRIEATIDQHLAIVAAVIAGHPSAARRAMTDHLDESAGVVQERAATAIARMIAGRRESR